ncbi:hypothetical protein IPM09_04260 [Candidatus Saccharibacteria bacterium]|nr:MAG: hypothetical protein IPM09_04260 [Candidatus Saccharibacteria bacterium]
MADTSVKQQIVDKIKDSNNVLVTVNSNPTVDELSAALAITLLINKLDKHATAVFSGAIPPAIEFLEPAKTFENTVDSLRDFIIALSKEKADHLRYKVVDDMVKIFITPYRTTISQNDLDFSQGDYNVEFVLAIGVKKEEDLDKALQSHGKILHDATVAAVSLDTPSNLGGIEWSDTKASSFSEMLFSLAEALKTDKAIIDEQIATAFLTGIVAATDRFSNDHTNAAVMTIAAQLMSAGANQQLVATKLQADNAISTPLKDNGDMKEGESAKVDKAEPALAKKEDAGALSISHVPEGNVEEVTKQVAAKESQAAISRAEEEIAKQADIAPLTAPSVPSAAPAMNVAVDQNAPLRGPVAMDQWKTKTEQEAYEPSLGGTLNATTEIAAEEKRREVADDRNHTILSHGGSGYMSGAPTYQAPINGTIDQADNEPSVQDVFAGNISVPPTAHVDAIQPPAPSVSSPTLAEIDAQNRANHSEAMDAVNQAFGPPVIGGAPNPVPAGLVPSSPPAAPPLGLPTLPPMPDFSTLPPLPGETAGPLGSASVPDTLGSILGPPPITPAAPAVTADPAQFKIPGQ